MVGGLDGLSCGGDWTGAGVQELKVELGAGALNGRDLGLRTGSTSCWWYAFRQLV